MPRSANRFAILLPSSLSQPSRNLGPSLPSLVQAEYVYKRSSNYTAASIPFTRLDRQPARHLRFSLALLRRGR